MVSSLTLIVVVDMILTLNEMFCVGTNFIRCFFYFERNDEEEVEHTSHDQAFAWIVYEDKVSWIYDHG